jgi:aminoglycoside phosphotransferase (APT) family kinase protein
VLDAAVTTHRLVDAHAGTTGRAVIELEYADKAVDLPSRLFVKLPPADEMQRAFVTSSGMGEREARFYSELGAEVPVRVPRCYFSDWDDSGEEYIMLLEHLEDSGCTFQNASTRYSLDYVRSVVDEFARLHAAYWESPRFENDLDWVQPPVQHAIAVDLISASLAQHGGSMPPVFTRMAELYLAHTDAIHKLWKHGANTLVHGDVHDANLFMDGDRPGFLDWAIVSRAPAMRDVGYFLAGTLEAADREALPGLVDHYRDALATAGVTPPSRDELWQQCQWHAAYVWVGAAVTLAMGDAWQPVGYVLASLERLHGAMDYLDSVDALQAAL